MEKEQWLFPKKEQFWLVENNCRIWIMNILSDSLYKESVDFIFDKFHQFNEIWTKEEYCQYLKTIYPESEIKVPVWHWTDSKFDYFKDIFLQKKDLWYYWKWFYFREWKEWKSWATHVANLYWNNEKNVKCVMINVKNPKYIEDWDFSKSWIEFDWFDWTIVLSRFDPDFLDDTFQVCVQSANQIHELWTKKDLQWFKEYVKNRRYSQ